MFPPLITDSADQTQLQSQSELLAKLLDAKSLMACAFFLYVLKLSRAKQFNTALTHDPLIVFFTNIHVFTDESAEFALLLANLNLYKGLEPDRSMRGIMSAIAQLLRLPISWELQKMMGEFCETNLPSNGEFALLGMIMAYATLIAFSMAYSRANRAHPEMLHLYRERSGGDRPPHVYLPEEGTFYTPSPSPPPPTPRHIISRPFSTPEPTL